MKIIYKAALGLNGLNPGNKVTRAEVIMNAMQASGNFPASTMPISYTMLDTLKNNLHSAIITAGIGATGSTSKMHEQESLLVNAFNFVKAFVEQVANETVNPDAIIESAAMTVFSTSGHTPVKILTLTAIGNGTVKVYVPRGKGEAAFVFQSSIDGINWLEFASSKLATTELKNQTPGTTLYFRFAAIGNSKGTFSQAKSTIVL